MRAKEEGTAEGGESPETTCKGDPREKDIRKEGWGCAVEESFVKASGIP